MIAPNVQKVRLVAAALAVVVPAMAAAQFRTSVEAVRVDVFVSDRGRPLLGLTNDDFEIRDSGVLQQVDHVSFEETPLNVVLVLDISGSLGAKRLAGLGEAAGALLEGLRGDDQAALVTFSHVVEERVALTSDFAAVRQGLAALQGGGHTSLADAIYTGMLLAQSDADRAIVVVLSDGVDTMSWLTAEAVVDTAKRSDVVVYSVYTGGPRAPALLRDLGSATGGSVFENISVDRVRETFTRIASEFRQRYLVTYSPRGVKPAGWHPIDVRIKGRRANVKARPGYMREGGGAQPQAGAMPRLPDSRQTRGLR